MCLINLIELFLAVHCINKALSIDLATSIIFLKKILQPRLKPCTLGPETIVLKLCYFFQPSKTGGGRPLYGYIQGFGFSEYLTEAHPSDKNIISPKTSTMTKPPAALPIEVGQQLTSAWSSQDTQQDLSQPSSLNTSDFAQDNIYEVCGERSGPVEITVQGSPVPIPTTLSMDSSTSGGYGSIPHLDASPRRYRYIDSDSDSLFHRDSPSSSLSVPVAGRHVGLTQHEVSDSPPKLPERAPKTLNSGAPPPLPPKKPLSNQNSKTSIKNVSMNSNVALMAACFAESSRMGASDDIYDFPPEPMIGNVSLNQEEAKQCITDILKTSRSIPKPGPAMPDLGSVTIEELSRMSVMELNEKMTAGLIPEELKGMSIFELVDFVAKHMKMKKVQEEEEEERGSFPEMGNNFAAQDQQQPTNAPMSTSMKPSFSDNFVAEKLAPAQKLEQLVPASVPASQPQLSNLDIIAGLSKKSPLTNMNSNVSSNTDEMSKCFDDDFAHFQLPTSSISGRESSVSEQDKEPIYDKYAVFRELQMEEELLRAWKTPSEEEKEKQGGDQDQDENEEKSDDNDDNDEDDDEDEDEEDEREEKQNDLIVGRDEDSQERPICSSEGSPRSRSRSDTGSIQKSVSEDGTLDDLKIGSEVGSHDHHDHDPKRESQIPIFFVEEGNADADVDDASDDDNDKRIAEAAAKLAAADGVANDNDVDDKANDFEANFEAALGHPSTAAATSQGHGHGHGLAAHPDANKFEHNFDEAFGPAGDLTVTKDWTTFEDDSSQQFAETSNDLHEEQLQQHHQQPQHHQQQQQQQQQYLDRAGDSEQHFSMGSFTLTEEEQREVEFERLKQEELRQQQALFEEQKRLQAELQHQYALQKELQFHRQVLASQWS